MVCHHGGDVISKGVQFDQHLRKLRLIPFLPRIIWQASIPEDDTNADRPGKWRRVRRQLYAINREMRSAVCPGKESRNCTVLMRLCVGYTPLKEMVCLQKQ